MYSKSPLSFRFYDASPENSSYYGRLYVPTPRSAKIPEVVEGIPRDAVVSASLFLATYFTHHRAVLPFPGGVEAGHWRPATHIVVDLNERWLFNSQVQRRIYEEALADEEWERLPAPDGFVVLRRRKAPDGR